MLKAAYLYYWTDEEIMSDKEYDMLTKFVSAYEHEITHPLKHLVDFESLKTCSSLHYINKEDYYFDG